MTNPLLDAINKKRSTPGTEKFENAHPRTLSHILLKHTPLRYIYILVPKIRTLIPQRTTPALKPLLSGTSLSTNPVEYLNKIPWRSVQIIFLSLLFVGIFFTGIFYLRGRPPKPPKITDSPGSSLYLFETGNEDFSAKIGTKQATIPFISFDSKTGTNASFSMVGSQSVEAKRTGGKIVYPNVRPDTDVAYSPVLKGIKEEIVLNRATSSAEFVFNLTTSARPRPIAGDFFSPFFFDNQNNYQFHFEKPFAVDANGNRTEDIAFSIRKSKEKENEYQIKIAIESSWLTAPNRVYPVTIDPTIIYDTTTEFATGILNRVKDIGSGASPSLVTYYQERAVSSNTTGLWRLDEVSDNSCPGGLDFCDKSGNSYHMTATGTTVTTNAIIGAAARTFNGTSDMATTNVAISNFITPSEGTLSVWIKPAGSAPSVANVWLGQQIIADSNGNLGLYRAIIGGNDYIWAYNWDTDQDRIGTTYPTNQWSHVAWVHKANTLYLYFNGNLVGSVASGNSILTGLLGLGRPYASGAFFNGDMDEVIVSNTAMTAEEIKAMASRPPYSVYTSEVLDLAKVSSWNPLSWIELGVSTGDGETLKDATSLVAQWNFNNTSGTTATNDAGSCGASCNGTLTNFANTTGQDVSPSSGWTSVHRRWGVGALSFDSTNDYVTVPDNNSLSPGNGNYTIEQWFKTSHNYASAKGWLFSNYGSVSNNLAGLIVETDNKLDCLYRDGAGNLAQIINQGPFVNDGNWHHTACSRTGTTINLYLDGKLIGTNTNASLGNIATTGKTKTIGTYADSVGTQNYKGEIDSTRIYSRALTPSEIMSNYIAGNIELQTRVGNDTSPDDGSWEEWRPITNETQIDALEDLTNWSVNSKDPASQTLLTNKSPDINTGTGSDGACSITSVDSNINTGSCAGRGTADAVSFNLSAPLAGGQLSYSNGNVFHQFKTSGNHTLYAPAGAGRNVEVLVVAGGGGGGMDMGGGGGGGGVLYNAAYSVASSTTISVSVGAGGAGAPAGGTFGQPSAHQFTIGATNGGNSVFGTMNAVGGGRGGSSYYQYTPGPAGAAGGSGGGASGYSDGGTRTGGAGTGGQGNAGGNGGGQYYSGGGGGAGAAGTSSTAIAHGGAGVLNAILGPNYYWGGGGGGSGFSICGGNGGIGGGGGGAVCTTTGGGSALNPGLPGWGGSVSSQTNKQGGDGGENTGGGGGGGSHYNATNKGGNGGSGIVIVKYPYTLYPIAAGDTSITLPVSPTGLAVGDDFIIINLQGNPENNNNVGDYEIHTISGINGNTISFTDYPLRYSYDVTTQRIVLQRVPNYTNVTIGRTPSGNNGSSSGTAGYSCKDLRDSGVVADGNYWIDPDGAGGNAPFQAVCNMTRDGGGWTMVVKAWYQSGAAGNSGATGSLADAVALKGNPFKFADSTINQIIGSSQNYDVMIDQAGYNSGYSTGNFEYVLIRNYTAPFRFDIGMPESRTTTVMESRRISDNYLASTFNLKCGGYGSAGINCVDVIENNPGGGAYCNLQMGSSTNAGWHHLAMSWYNTDTYLYICNGAQHSSGQNMNHRAWIRERKPVSMTVSAWDGTTGGLLAFKANGTLTLNSTGAITGDGKGFKGGISTGASAGVFRAFSGESYGGPAYAARGYNATPNFGGGAGSSLAIGGPGGGYGSPGYLGHITRGEIYIPYRSFPGNTYGDPALNKLFLGSGGGGGGDGYNAAIGWGQTAAAKGVGGAGGGIILINANTITLDNSSAISAEGESGTTGWDNIAANWINGGAGGGGSGGSIKIYGNTASIGSDVIRANGGQSSKPYQGSYANGYDIPPEGGDGGAGRIAINYGTSVTGETSPASLTQKIESQKIKIEGSGALNFKPINISDSTVGYWHFGEDTSGKTFVYTGADQTYTVPSGVTSVNVKMWGGGGGAGYLGGWTYGYAGGGGGYTTGDIAVTPGQQLTVMVGAGGTSGNVANSVDGYGGGAKSCNGGGDCRYGGQGGGRSAIRSGGADLLTAGGGGGGGATLTTVSCAFGGGGGGSSGQGGASCTDGNQGNGGTQVAGGAGGTGNQVSGTAGSQYLGGRPNSVNSYGGSGGGGWYGGGGAGYSTAPMSQMGGGGGGSGYIGGAGVSNATTTAAAGRIQANSTDIDNGGAGAGGIGGSVYFYGTPGKVVITPNADVIASPFQEKDSSGNKNHGTLVGTTLVNGVIGKARSFNGTTDYIDMGSDSRFDFLDTFSFEAWVNPTSLSGCGNPNSPTCIIANKEYSYEWALDLNGNLYWAIMPNWAWVNTGLTLPVNKWSHVALVHDGKFVTTYLNGGTDGVNKVVKTGFIDKTGYSLRIGSRIAVSNFFSGKIDEVRFDKVARSQSDIYKSYLLGAGQQLTKTISSIDLSGSNSLPFYIAADRPGTYLQATIAESNFAAGLPDTNTVGLWHLEEDPPHFTDVFTGTALGTSLWTEFDPNGNKISQNNGLVLSAGTVDAWDSGIISTDTWNRSQGLTLYGKFTTGASPNNMMVGFAVNNTGVASYTNITHALYFASGTLSVYQDGSQIGTYGSGYGANTQYEFKITLTKENQAAYSIKGGAYTSWTTLLTADNYKTNTPLRVQVAQFRAAGTINELSVYPSTLSITDSGLYKNHGYSGGHTLIPGKIGQAQSFTGINAITVPNSPSLNFGTGDFSVSYWIKGGTPTGWVSVLGKVPAWCAPNGWLFGNNTSGGTGLLFQVCDNNTNPSATALSVFDNNWHFITGQRVGSTLEIYKDGVLQSTATSNTNVTNSSNLLIGGVGGYSVNALIDEITITNNSKSAAEIRQAYEAGIRSHPITIDFGASLDSGNLITNSADTGFTINATTTGLSQKGSMIFKGDKIIVKETSGDLEYLAQGTVTSVNESTGALTVASWDSGSTFPSIGFTTNAVVFKWQREYWNISEPLNDQLNSTTKLNIRLTAGGEGRTVWVDDLRSNSDYLTNPSGSTITSSTNNRYFQYRAIIHSFDEAVTATLSGVTVDYVQNNPPNIPTLDSPSDGAISQPFLAVLKTTTADPEVDYLQYKIQLCENLAMTTNCQTFDQSVSQTGWSGQNTQGGTAYTSGTQATYTLQSPLAVGTTYFWRSYAIDPGGVNVFGNTQPTPNSFTTNDRPEIPSLDTPADTAVGVLLSPVLQTTTTDVDSDYLQYKIEICTNPAMSTNCQTFDQSLSQTGWSGQDAQTGTAYASGTQASYTLQTPLTQNTTYYWRTSAIDPAGSNTFSATQVTPFSFTTNILPGLPVLDAPANGATGVSITPTFQTTATDGNNDFLRYRLLLCINQVMTLNCQTFDQTVSQVGWSGQDAQTGTAYASGTQASFTVQTPLVTNTIYYWKTSAIDPAGTNTFGPTQANPFSFTTIAAPAEPSTCTVEKDRDNTQITIRWTDNSQAENGFQIWKVTDGAAPEHLTPDFAANTTSYTDTNVTSNHTYGYLIRSFQYDGQNTLYSNWCPTATSNLFSGGFTII